MGTISLAPILERLPGGGRRLAALALLAALVVGLQGARGLYDPDEGRYAAVAMQMVRSGDWFTPRLNDELPHFTKPPLTYWLLAGSMELLGENEWALRLPSALAFAATVLLTWGVARRLVPDDPVLAPIVQATSLLPVVAANLVTSDPLVVVWETLAVFAFVVHWWDRPSPRWAPTLLWVGFGLAFLTKGPPGLLPLAAIVAFVAGSERAAGLRRLVDPPGLGLFAVVAFGWFVLQTLVRPDLLPYLVGDEVVGRIAGEHQRNPGWSGLVGSYLPVVALGLFPWTLIAWRRPRGSRPAPPSGPPAAGRFLGIWLLLPLAVFAAAQSRLPLYLLPVTVPASLLVGRRLAGYRPRWALPALALWIVALVGLEAVAAFQPHDRDGRRFARELARLLPESPSEVVFVDDKPRWSLEVYLGCKVESVEVVKDLRAREGPAYRPVAETLSGELSELEEGAVHLVPEPSLPSWRSELRRRGWSVRRLGEAGEYQVFATAPPPSEPGLVLRAPWTATPVRSARSPRHLGGRGTSAGGVGLGEEGGVALLPQVAQRSALAPWPTGPSGWGPVPSGLHRETAADGRVGVDGRIGVLDLEVDHVPVAGVAAPAAHSGRTAVGGPDGRPGGRLPVGAGEVLDAPGVGVRRRAAGHGARAVGVADVLHRILVPGAAGDRGDEGARAVDLEALGVGAAVLEARRLDAAREDHRVGIHSEGVPSVRERRRIGERPRAARAVAGLRLVDR